MRGLRHGDVAVTNAQPRRHAQAAHQPGSFVGEMALLSKIPRTATVTAVTDLDVLVITDRAFLDLLNRMPDLWLKVARALAERVGADESNDPK